jgi:hypothetical protein
MLTQSVDEVALYPPDLSLSRNATSADSYVHQARAAEAIRGHGNNL